MPPLSTTILTARKIERERRRKKKRKMVFLAVIEGRSIFISHLTDRKRRKRKGAVNVCPGRISIPSTTSQTES